MENADAFAASTAPVTCHDFLERMRHPSASDFVKSIKSFIVTFVNNMPNPEKDSASVQEFLSSMEGAFRTHSLWAGASEEELESAYEGLEKYVMTKLYSRAFASVPEEVKHDEELSEKMALIQQFIRPENLDIQPNFQNETSWLLAQKELQKINMYKAPRDKLVCILNCCKVINNLLLNAALATNENPPGADEFLPVLIYVTIKANPPQLHSNLLYIQRYRRQSRLVSEAAYFYTNMLSAESFISSINAQSLSMDEVEFDKNMESARAVLAGLSAYTEHASDPTNSDPEIPEDRKPKVLSWKPKNLLNNFLPARGDQHSNQGSVKLDETKVESDVRGSSRPEGSSISDLERKGALALLKEDQISRSFREYPYLYARAGDLTVEDVEALLESYKHLVLKYVSLLKGTGRDSSLPDHAMQRIPSKEFEGSADSGITDMKNEMAELKNENHDGIVRVDSMDVLSVSGLVPSDASLAEEPSRASSG
ncbi:Vacuolar sorting-associated protein 9A [Nymphaea thermarum]|nr:Vacuolar sorting-associated protein 9A [Nymphaea thermarum]